MADSSKITEKNLQTLAETILDPKAWPHIATFLSTATKNELKGLKIVASIHKHQGKKKFRPKPNHSEPSSINTLDLLKKKYLQSYYNSEYCKDSGPETDILKYKKLSELKCSEILSKPCLETVQNWLSLKDDPHYQDLMLMFLRGIFSVYKTQEAVPSSSHRESYAWTRGVGKSESPLKNLVNKIQPAENKPNKRSESTNLPKIQQKREILNQSPKFQVLKSLKGSGDITSWMGNVHSKHTSLYQDTFVPLYYKKEYAGKSDFHTSIVFKLLPGSREE